MVHSHIRYVQERNQKNIKKKKKISAPTHLVAPLADEAVQVLTSGGEGGYPFVRDLITPRDVDRVQMTTAIATTARHATAYAPLCGRPSVHLCTGLTELIALAAGPNKKLKKKK